MVLHGALLLSTVDVLWLACEVAETARDTPHALSCGSGRRLWVHLGGGKEVRAANGSAGGGGGLVCVSGSFHSIWNEICRPC